MSMLKSPNMAGLLAREHARDLRRLAGTPRLHGRRDIRHRSRPIPEPLSEQQACGIAALLNLLADPVRLRLISLIAAHLGGQACVCELTKALDGNLGQGTVSGTALQARRQPFRMPRGRRAGAR